MQGYLSKKNDKNKKWKPMYCVLLVDGSDTQLMYYENPKVCFFFSFEDFQVIFILSFSHLKLMPSCLFFLWFFCRELSQKVLWI